MLEPLRQSRIMPVIIIDDVDQALHTAEALLAGGLAVGEITFRTAAAAAAISAVKQRFPGLLLGAGTILNVTDLDRAIQAGAAFAVAPGCNPTVVSAANARGFAFFPGVATPSDIEVALGLGVKTLKLFPAEAIGGAKLLKALIAPYRHTGVGFVPTGGITAENMGGYLALKETVAVGGSWMVAPELLRAGKWAEVTALTKAAVAAAQAAPAK